MINCRSSYSCNCRIARAFNKFRATPAEALDIFKAFKHFTNLSPMEFQVRYLALFLLFLVIDSFKWFWMRNLYKNIRLTLGFLKAPFLALHLFHYTLMIFLIMLSVILLSMLMILLYSKCDRASDLWQQLELASELKSDL